MRIRSNISSSSTSAPLPTAAVNPPLMSNIQVMIHDPLASIFPEEVLSGRCKPLDDTDNPQRFNETPRNTTVKI